MTRTLVINGCGEGLIKNIGGNSQNFTRTSAEFFPGKKMCEISGSKSSP